MEHRATIGQLQLMRSGRGGRANRQQNQQFSLGTGVAAERIVEVKLHYKEKFCILSTAVSSLNLNWLTESSCKCFKNLDTATTEISFWNSSGKMVLANDNNVRQVIGKKKKIELHLSSLADEDMTINIIEIGQKLGGLTDQIIHLQTQITEMKTEITEMKTEITEVKTAVNGMEQRLRALEPAVDEPPDEQKVKRCKYGVQQSHEKIVLKSPMICDIKLKIEEQPRVHSTKSPHLDLKISSKVPKSESYFKPHIHTMRTTSENKYFYKT